LNCRNCGDPVPEERAGAGYDYCMKTACVQTCIRPLNVVAVAVNKSNDQLVLREQLDLPRTVGRSRADGGQYGVVRRPARREAEALTDGQRIARMRERLEARLGSCRDQAERTKLIDSYNARVRRMNIRYRHTALYRQDDPTRASS
jgi:hypothetical protein